MPNLSTVHCNQQTNRSLILTASTNLSTTEVRHCSLNALSMAVPPFRVFGFVLCVCVCVCVCVRVGVCNLNNNL